MARPRRIFWLASLAVAAYFLWRWQKRRQVAAFLPPAPPTPAPTPPPAPAPALRADASGTPRRIPTRVHRGAPPSMADRAKQVAETVQETAAAVAEKAHEAVDQAVAAGADVLKQAEATLGAAAEQAQEAVEQARETAADVAEQAEEKSAEVVEQVQETAADVAEQAREAIADIGSSRAVGEAVDAGSTPEEADTSAVDSAPTEPVNVNTADLETLIALRGIGAVLAERIVRYRTDNGPFMSIEELTEVPGIGARNLATFRHLITV